LAAVAAPARQVETSPAITISLAKPLIDFM
jgi:hypothetical protein